LESGVLRCVRAHHTSAVDDRGRLDNTEEHQHLCGAAAPRRRRPSIWKRWGRCR